MTNRNRIVFSILVGLLLFGSVLVLAQEQFLGTVLQQEPAMEEAGSESELEAQVEENQEPGGVETAEPDAAAEAVPASGSLQAMLAGRGLYADEISRDITRFNELILSTEITGEEIAYIKSLVSGGKDLNPLMDMYYFLLDCDEPLDFLETFYEGAERIHFEGGHWVENAYNVATENKTGVLDGQQVAEYLADVSLKDITAANILCRKGVYDIEEILDLLIGGTSWESIFNTVYGADFSGLGLDPLQMSDIVRTSVRTGIPVDQLSFDTLEQTRESRYLQRQTEKAGLLEPVPEYVPDDEYIDSLFTYQTPSEQLLPETQMAPMSLAEAEEEPTAYLTREQVDKWLDRGLVLREIKKGYDIAAAEGVTVDEVLRIYSNEHRWIGEEAAQQ